LVAKTCPSQQKAQTPGQFQLQPLILESRVWIPEGCY
jgi:hypothetical protein